MLQNYAKRHSTLLTVKEMLIALGNYFPLIRLAKTQRFNKMLSCFGYEKANMATHGWWEWGWWHFYGKELGNAQQKQPVLALWPTLHFQEPILKIHCKQNRKSWDEIIYWSSLWQSRSQMYGVRWERGYNGHKTQQTALWASREQGRSLQSGPRGALWKGKTWQRRAREMHSETGKKEDKSDFENVDMLILLNKGGLNRERERL